MKFNCSLARLLVNNNHCFSRL